MRFFVSSPAQAKGASRGASWFPSPAFALAEGALLEHPLEGLVRAPRGGQASVHGLSARKDAVDLRDDLGAIIPGAIFHVDGGLSMWVLACMLATLQPTPGGSPVIHHPVT